MLPGWMSSVVATSLWGGSRWGDFDSQVFPDTSGSYTRTASPGVWALQAQLLGLNLFAKWFFKKKLFI